MYESRAATPEVAAASTTTLATASSCAEERRWCGSNSGLPLQARQDEERRWGDAKRPPAKADARATLPLAACTMHGAALAGSTRRCGAPRGRTPAAGPHLQLMVATSGSGTSAPRSILPRNGSNWYVARRRTMACPGRWEAGRAAGRRGKVH